jgi:hypothetical protein
MQKYGTRWWICESNLAAKSYPIDISSKLQWCHLRLVHNVVFIEIETILFLIDKYNFDIQHAFKILPTIINERTVVETTSGNILTDTKETFSPRHSVTSICIPLMLCIDWPDLSNVSETKCQQFWIKTKNFRNNTTQIGNFYFLKVAVKLAMWHHLHRCRWAWESDN